MEHLYGWFSPTAWGLQGGCEYKNPAGEVVCVTEVTSGENSKPESAFEDIVSVGHLIEFVRNIRHENFKLE